jgi:hypothetical protein
MKKINLVATGLVLFLLTLNTNAQNTTDFFVGKWDLLVTGTPNGDAKMILSLERKDGKLDGKVIFGDQAGSANLFDIEDKGTLITFNITASDYVVRFSLEKKDDNHISGTMMDQFDTKGERILKEEITNANVQNRSDFFVGQWNLLVAGTPDGDIKMIVSLERKEGKLNGTIKIQELELSKFSNVEEKGTSIKLYFSAAGYDLYISLQKKDDNHVTGSEMDMFDVKGERITK